MSKWLFVIIALSFSFGCSSRGDLSLVESNEDMAAWKTRPFATKAVKIAPIVSKTVILKQQAVIKEQNVNNNKEENANTAK